MKQAVLIAALLLPASAFGQSSHVTFGTYGNGSVSIDSGLRATCVTMDDVVQLCGGDKPTIWMNPAMEPRDVADKFIEALRAIGYEPKAHP